MNRSKKFILVLGDLAIFIIALFLALKIRYGLGGVDYNVTEHLVIFGPVFIFWLPFYFLSLDFHRV